TRRNSLLTAHTMRHGFPPTSPNVFNDLLRIALLFLAADLGHFVFPLIALPVNLGRNQVVSEWNPIASAAGALVVLGLGNGKRSLGSRRVHAAFRLALVGCFG